MHYKLDTSATPSSNKSDCIVVAVFSNKKHAILGDSAKQLDEMSNGALTEIIDSGDFKGSLEQTQMLYKIKGVEASRVLMLGCGDQDSFDTVALNKAVKAATKSIKTSKIKSLSFYLTDTFSADDAARAFTQIVIAHGDCDYQLLDYKSDAKEESKLKKVKVALTAIDNANQSELKTAIENGAAIVEGMRLAKDLANHPGNVCTPTYIAKQSEIVAKEYKNITIDILEEKDMEKLGMGSFLSVSKGSDEPGKMIILEYNGAKDKKQAPIALVGKGITFDTGGISLKPGASMDEMKFDMGGAAGMLGTLKACAEMKLPINVVVVLAAAENMPSGRASKPGDIVTSMAGKTIEVLNTDAEGRLVLCDALTYVGKYKPEVVIDAATLTGACIVALGHHICAVLSNSDELANDILAAGNTINDRAWQLPMGDDYKKQLKSSFADLGNIGAGGGGTITAACFLGEFTKEYKWAHLDIAGTAWEGKDSTGRPVPLLSQYLINRAAEQ
ncbi:MAG: leucyl aminopeptidase [Cocleimonas sp.]